MKERTWDDLPWAAHPVTLVYRQRRVICRRCGIRTERIEFADAKARVTRRLRQQIGVDCQSDVAHYVLNFLVWWGFLFALASLPSRQHGTGGRQPTPDSPGDPAGARDPAPMRDFLTGADPADENDTKSSTKAAN